jgi:hypothetical protein
MAMTAQKSPSSGSEPVVTVGVREGAGESAPAPVRLVVSSFRHLADHCDQR